MTIDPPAMHTATEDRARQAIIDACRQMNALGINQGKSGNVSVRWSRGAGDGYLITPSALSYDRMTVDDIVWLALDADADRPVASVADRVFPATAGQPAPGPGPIPGRGVKSHSRRPSTEWRMHQAIYADQPAAGAVVHTHSPHASALACLPRIQRDGIPAFHYMVAMAGGHDIRCAGYATFGGAALAESTRLALVGRRACLIANHGQLAWGAGLDAALALAVEVETLARMYSLALALGEPVLLDAAEMDRVLVSFSSYGRG